MKPANQNRPLTDAEIETLEAGLEAIDPDDSMAVEELDGFCAALACCPDPIPRDEWLPLVLGSSERARRAAQAPEGEGPDAVLLRLVERHRVAVAATLYEGQGFAPVLAYDEDGSALGNAWAIGFVRAMGLRPDAWTPLDDDDEYADALEPLMRLVADAQQDEGSPDDDADDDGGLARDADDDTDPFLDAYEPIADDEREAVIHEMLDGVQDVYDFFRDARARALAPATIRRSPAKVGRNDPCSCGSGRKYKNCCGAGTVH
jgi:uncharacterized protein